MAPCLKSGIIALATALALNAPAGAAPGTLDALDLNILGSTVYATAVQPDGKMIIAGSFTSVLGVPRSNIARVNADGSLDIGFDPKPNSTWVSSVAVQADGKILLGGTFTTLQPNGAATATTRNKIARVNPDGSLDMGFDPNANADGHIYSIALQGDGKILLGGWFTTLQPNGAATTTTRNCIARVNPDGSPDMGFDPNASAQVHSMAVQVDGKILLGGNFTSLQPNGAPIATTRNKIARVNTDGSLDTDFDPKANSYVNSVAVQADGKILLGGYFTTLQPNGAATAITRNCIARVNADGSLDTGFDPNANYYVFSVAVQTDGKILLGGEFATLQPNGAATATTRHKIARVNADGSLDIGFDPNAVESGVSSVAVQADGKVLLGGGFTTLKPNGAASPTTRICFARINNDAAIETLSVPDVTQVQWQRGGASPEVSQVLFERSTNDGASWTALGSGTRVGTTANWQITGLTLPAVGQIRARGRTTNGYNNGGSGLVEAVVNYPVEIAVEEPVGTVLSDGTASIIFSPVNLGSSSAPKTFTITNLGTADLTLGLITKDGANPADFSVDTTGTLPTVAPGNSTTFQVTFNPAGISPSMRTAAIHISNNVSGNKNPFDINLTGTGLNNAPTISDIPDQTTNEDVNTGSLPLTIGDVETTTASLIVTGTSSNTTLVPNGNIAFSGSGANRSVVVTPAANKFGTTTMTITVSDGTASTTDTFLLTVISVNDAPTISDITDQTINEDANTGALSFTIGDVETAAASLTVTHASSNTALLPTANVVLGGSGASRSLTATPAANQFGTATITVTVSDGTASASDTFLLTVDPVNDAPTISNLTDQNINVNTLTNSLPFTIGDVETPAGSLSVSGTSSNPTLVLNGNIFFGGSGASRTVTVIPESDQIGSTTITVTVSDGLQTGTDTLVVNVVAPEIAVEQPFNTNIADGGSKSFGNGAVGTNTSLNFFIKNTGTADLTGLTITKDGTDATMFTITANPTAPVSGPNGNTAFTVRFSPTSAGPKTAAIHIASNDLDEDPFDITLTGTGVIPITDWRQTHFGSTANSGDGADLNDHDNDGLVNLVEYAFGLNPTQNSAGQLPQGQIVGVNYVLSFTEPVGITGVTYGAEWSATMASNDWHTITDTGTPPQHTFSVPIGSNTGMFVRLTVTSP